ncbi:hypothetical protein [Fibrella forsythiae]|uniref:DUF4149 domain-containing protein n=1 Tax=Fibrella forsythiae TaxID=2817061 RepID=A0ABS3JTM3_9BACT|nr:hypothetical protein [Fibrella forsythiae]MBO0952247.1 hypothetical protein [Fibrella forsythiae]
MKSAYADLIYLLIVAGVCGGTLFLLPENATTVELFNTYLTISKWQAWPLLTVVFAFLFFAAKQAFTGFSSPMGNRLVIALGFATVPFLTIVSRQAATLWANEKAHLIGYDQFQQRTWQIQFAIVAYLVYVAYQWGNHEK